MSPRFPGVTEFRSVTRTAVLKAQGFEPLVFSIPPYRARDWDDATNGRGYAHQWHLLGPFTSSAVPPLLLIPQGASPDVRAARFARHSKSHAARGAPAHVNGGDICARRVWVQQLTVRFQSVREQEAWFAADAGVGTGFEGAAGAEIFPSIECHQLPIIFGE
ncbi:hypothetical protein C8F04DRAFT_1180601 [Mycena alexandri]|uniref:Uncharacterized protein n=1 Tax=Mycena alexandri TaxID=1745969 RepID=A0AAD6T138_9AGAR|nr:hypothetical protein C8F04DRAFT_1180601 [Mycena alexandri]